MQFLQDCGLYESREEAMRREEVLGILDRVSCVANYYHKPVANRKLSLPRSMSIYGPRELRRWSRSG